MTQPLRVLLATDAFPPRCGGSGWSTYEVARALRDRGHTIEIVKPHRGARSNERHEVATAVRGGLESYDGFEPRLFHFTAPDVPYLRNYFKNERLTRRLAPALAAFIREKRIDIVHAQHVLTTPAAVAAGRATDVPVVCTIRDYWPVCYWSDLMLDPAAGALCPGCSASRMTQCVRPRAGAAWPAALPMIPYMRRNLAGKRRAIAAADAIVAVSSTIARDLRERAPEIDGRRLHVIPNPVKTKAIRETVAGSARPRPGEYALYVGKLEPNKGAGKLVPAMARTPAALPLVVVGDGSMRAEIERQAAAQQREVQLTGWLDRDAVLVWMAHAAMLVFPSHGPESLSRVLLEAGALGVAIAAMDTGGTRDIIADEVTGLLCRTTSELADEVARLAHDPDLRDRLGRAARAHIDASFEAGAVVERIEALYRDVARGRPADPAKAVR